MKIQIPVPQIHIPILQIMKTVMFQNCWVRAIVPVRKFVPHRHLTKHNLAVLGHIQKNLPTNFSVGVTLEATGITRIRQRSVGNRCCCKHPPFSDLKQKKKSCEIVGCCCEVVPVVRQLPYSYCSALTAARNVLLVLLLLVAQLALQLDCQSDSDHAFGSFNYDPSSSTSFQF